MEKQSEKDTIDDQGPKEETDAFGAYLVGTFPLHRRLEV